jgi:regulator of protease activity HflC (stomatin/prohibitin superfamily)
MSKPGDGTDRPNNRTTTANSGQQTNTGVRADWRGLRFEEEVKATKTHRLAAAVSRSVSAVLETLGIKRKRNAQGELEPRNWKRLGAVIGTAVLVILVWTSVHIVPPGNVAVPVTLGNPGEAIGSGIHVTWPFTQTKNMSIRTQAYSMTSAKGEGATGDDAIVVLGRDGGSASIDATVLYRMDKANAEDVYTTLGTNLTQTIIRPSARSCIRSEFTNYNMVDAATSSWHDAEGRVAQCMKDAIEPRGLTLQDFQLREVRMSDQIQKSIDAKVASQQRVIQLGYDYEAAQKEAEIAAARAAGTSDARNIIDCGYEAKTVDSNGQQVTTMVPKTGNCTPLPQEYLQLEYIKALQNLVTSQNSSTIIMPFGQGLIPELNINGTNGSGQTATDGSGSTSGDSTTTPTTAAPSAGR